jgi:zinc/manganese transport system permease protein
MINLLLPVFLLSLVLLGIHSYFGLEIIRRGIIFTDLAIGQFSALGAATALLAFDGRLVYPLSLAFALLAGLLITIATKKTQHVEAFIGILYAVGISGVFLLLAKSPHGMEKFQDLMAADILFTPWHAIALTALKYGALGLVIVFLIRRTRGALHDALFFLTFALTVTSSVALAGVLVVFAILIGPASIVQSLGLRHAVPLAWAIGTAINLAAILCSYSLDFPTGYTLVFFHSTAAAAVFIIAKRKGDTGRG